MYYTATLISGPYSSDRLTVYKYVIYININTVYIYIYMYIYVCVYIHIPAFTCPSSGAFAFTFPSVCEGIENANTSHTHRHSGAHCQLYIQKAQTTSQTGAHWSTVNCTYRGHRQPETMSLPSYWHSVNANATAAEDTQRAQSERERNANSIPALSYGSFYAFDFALKKSNQYWSNYVAPFMRLPLRYLCVTYAFIFRSVHAVIQNATTWVTPC